MTEDEGGRTIWETTISVGVIPDRPSTVVFAVVKASADERETVSRLRAALRRLRSERGSPSPTDPDQAPDPAETPEIQ